MSKRVKVLLVVFAAMIFAASTFVAFAEYLITYVPADQVVTRNGIQPLTVADAIRKTADLYESRLLATWKALEMSIALNIFSFVLLVVCALWRTKQDSEAST